MSRGWIKFSIIDDRCSFFHGDIGRAEAQTYLCQNIRLGSFLIRYSARQKCYCASFISGVATDGTPSFKHNLIYHLNSVQRIGQDDDKPNRVLL